MKRLHAVSVALTLVLFSQFNAYANHAPYIGSEWQKKKLLPYESCKIVNQGSRYVAAGSGVSLIAGTVLLPEYQSYELKCTSSENDFEFRIPVSIGSPFMLGLNFDFNITELDLSVSHLHEKSPVDLQGTFRGGILGASGLVGGKAAWMRNENGVHLKMRSLSIFLGANMGYVAMDVHWAAPLIYAKDQHGNEACLEVRDSLSDYKFVSLNHLAKEAK